MINETTLSYGMRHKIGKTIKEAISSSGMSDIEIGNALGVTRSTIYLWRTKRDSVIRKSNLVSLSKLLKKDIEYNVSMGIVEFTEIKEIIKDKNKIEEIDMSSNETQMLVTTQSKTIDMLMDRITKLEEDDRKNKEILRKQDETIKKLYKMPPNLNLDHTRMQFIVNMEKQTFVNVTQSYADLYEVNALEMTKNWTWSNVVDEEDFWRFAIIETLDHKRLEVPHTWKVLKNKEVFYVETNTIDLDDEGVLKRVDASLSTIEKWKESNRWYKAQQPQTGKS